MVTHSIGGLNLKMVEWANALQISMIGGAFVFAYIASTIRLNERWDNSIKLLFYLFAIGMLLASTGMNYPILQYEDSDLINDSNLGGPLRGIFVTQLGIVGGLFLILFIFALVSVVFLFKEKRNKDEYG